MEGGAAIRFGLFLLFWIVYFLIIYLLCTYFYRKLSGKPPKEENRLILVKGQTVSAKTAWQERDQQLRKRFMRIAMILMFVPLILPIILLILRLIG